LRLCSVTSSKAQARKGRQWPGPPPPTCCMSLASLVICISLLCASASCILHPTSCSVRCCTSSSSAMLAEASASAPAPDQPAPSPASPAGAPGEGQPAPGLDEGEGCDWRGGVSGAEAPSAGGASLWNMREMSAMMRERDMAVALVPAAGGRAGRGEGAWAARRGRRGRPCRQRGSSLAPGLGGGACC
jgi:hypothetical protein